MLSKSAFATDGLRELKFNWMPIYTAFVDSLDAEDARTGVSVEDILELQHDVTNKDTYPLYANVKLDNGIAVPLSTKPVAEAFADLGLTTTAVIESTAWDKELFYDALSYYSNKGMLSKVVGPMHTHVVGLDKPYLYHSNNFTNPSVKRGNPYTFCGILFNLPQAQDGDQLHFTGETTPIAHLNISGRVRFDEWNPNFDQNAY